MEIAIQMYWQHRDVPSCVDWRMLWCNLRTVPCYVIELPGSQPGKACLQALLLRLNQTDAVNTAPPTAVCRITDAAVGEPRGAGVQEGQEAFLRQQIAAYFESEGAFSLQGKLHSLCKVSSAVHAC